MLKEEEYFLKDYKPPYKVFDKTRSVSVKDMDTNIGPKMRNLSPTSRKVFIQPLAAQDKQGPIWGSWIS